MQESRFANCNNEKLNNGLTADQVQSAKKLLRKVDQKKLCKKMGISSYKIYDVLRDKSPRVDLLNKVLKKARKEVAKFDKSLKEIPVLND